MSLHAAATCKNLAACLVTLSRYAEAALFQAWSVEIYMKLLGMHIETARAIFEYAQTLASMEEWAAAADCVLLALHMVCIGVARDEHVKKVVKTLIETDAAFFHVRLASTCCLCNVCDTARCSCCARRVVFKTLCRILHALSLLHC
jgi:hypothetical protein